MGRFLKAPFSICLCLIFGLLAGCAIQNRIVAPPPPWYQLDSGLYPSSEGGVFFGIGRADGIHNLTLLRVTADNQARKALAEVLEQYVAELSHSAKLRSDPAWMSLSAEERQQILGELVRSSVKRGVVSDHWKDDQNPRLMALCRLNLATFKQVLSNSSALGDKTRAVMRSEVEAVHARLAKKR